MKKAPSPIVKDSRVGSSPAATRAGMAASAKKLERRYEKPGPRDVSVNIDHYPYGAPKKKV